MFVGEAGVVLAHVAERVFCELIAFLEAETGGIAGKNGAEGIDGERGGEICDVGLVGIGVTGNVEVADGDMSMPVSTVVARWRTVKNSVVNGVVRMEVGAAPVLENAFASFVGDVVRELARAW